MILPVVVQKPKDVVVDPIITCRVDEGPTKHPEWRCGIHGVQKTGAGEASALHKITAVGHPSLGSAVADVSLLKLNLQIPQTPLPPGAKC